MTLREWYAFNKQVWKKGDMIVAINRANSWKKDDQLMEALLQNAVAIELFGDFELKSISIDAAPGTDYKTIRCFLWKLEPQNNEEED